MVFQENKEATELLLNILLKRGDIEVMEVITQKEEKNPIIGGRSIVLDIFAKDSEGKNYDVDYSDFRIIPIDRVHSMFLRLYTQIYRNNF